MKLGKSKLGRSKLKKTLCCVLAVLGMAAIAAQAGAAKPMNAKKFDAASTAALEAMKQKAAELNIQGVAVVNYVPGDAVEGWSSRMAVVGRLTDPAGTDGKGNNLLGIAYAKSAEMARTLKDSGTAGGAPMTGEFGWQGGVVLKVTGGYLIVAFSGGKSEQDVQVSKAGLEVIRKGL
jgi:hypothetical protein